MGKLCGKRTERILLLFSTVICLYTVFFGSLSEYNGCLGPESGCTKVQEVVCSSTQQEEAVAASDAALAPSGVLYAAAGKTTYRQGYRLYFNSISDVFIKTAVIPQFMFVFSVDTASEAVSLMRQILKFIHGADGKKEGKGWQTKVLPVFCVQKNRLKMILPVKDWT